ncbi:RDD family protein [Zooshikella sp. RANM57]|uniref:RDD family protein n=1 Tax=Zooshikella sp. RANM57 TaxID=3425863 RepID=UPI003D6DEFAB
MNSSEIYQAPEAELKENQSEDCKLASLSRRFWATVIDKIIFLSVITIPWLIFDWLGVDNSKFQDEHYISVLILLLYFALNVYLLVVGGQTIGKKLLKIAIVRSEDGEKQNIFIILIFRMLLFWIGCFIINFLFLIDSLFIFGGGRRCLHDLAASTKVIDLKK